MKEYLELQKIFCRGIEIKSDYLSCSSIVQMP